MRRSLVSLWVISCIAASIARGQIVTKATPHGLEPIFIPATELFESGQFSPGVPSSWRDQIRDHAKLAAAARRYAISRGDASALTPELCAGMTLGEPDFEISVARNSREAAVTNAKAIFSGTISQVTPGLFYGSPASLLRVTNVVALKSDQEYAHIRGTLLVRHPYAYFSAGGYEFCRESAAGAYAPRAGDRILVFAFDSPPDEAKILVPSRGTDVITERADGNLFIPQSLEFFRRPTRGTGMQSVIDDIAAMISRQQKAVP